MASPEQVSLLGCHAVNLVVTSWHNLSASGGINLLDTFSKVLVVDGMNAFYVTLCYINVLQLNQSRLFAS